MPQLNNLPNFPTPLTNDAGGKRVTGKDWYFFWAGLYQGLPPALPLNITLSTSPFTYSPSVKGNVFVSGGTVSDISFSRDGTNIYPTGAIAGPFQINANDRLIITYTVAPTMSFAPT